MPHWLKIITVISKPQEVAKGSATEISTGMVPPETYEVGIVTINIVPNPELVGKLLWHAEQSE